MISWLWLIPAVVLGAFVMLVLSYIVYHRNQQKVKDWRYD